MDPAYALPLVLIPAAIVVAGYVLARRGKTQRVRKSGNWIAALTLGLVGLFVSWWALGMTMGIWALDGSGFGPHSTKEILLALAEQIFVLVFPVAAWYFCARFAKTAKKDRVDMKTESQ